MKSCLGMAAALIAATATGCLDLESEPEVGGDELQLVGHHDTDENTCTPYTQALVDRASRLARTVMNSDAFEQCIQQKMTADYVHCGDPFPTLSRNAQIRKAWEASQKANHMKYTCSYESVAGISAQAGNQGWGTRDTHTVDLADDWHDFFRDWRNYSGIQPLDWRAAGLAHEFMHTHDYNHLNEGCPAGYDGGVSSAPYIYGTCVYEIINESYSNCADFDSGDTDEYSLVDSWPATSSCERVTDSQHRVALRTHNDHYLSAFNGGGSGVDAHGAGHGKWETLFLVDINRGRLMHGDWVHVKTFEGSFWGRRGGGLDARIVDPGVSSAARFQVLITGGGELGLGKEIRLRAANRRYVVAEGGGGGAVNANRTRAGAWERFTVEEPRRAHVVRLRADSTRRFVHVDDAGAMGVNARKSNEDEDQAFWILDHNGGELEDGDSISFETLRTSRFVSTCSGGTGQATARADYVSACSTFIIGKLGGSAGTRIGHRDPVAFKSSNGRYLTGVPSYPGISYQLRNYAPSVGPWQRFTMESVQGNRWDAR